MYAKKVYCFWREEDEKGSEKKMSNFLRLKKKRKICIIRTFESLDMFLYGRIASNMETSLFFTSDL